MYRLVLTREDSRTYIQYLGPDWQTLDEKILAGYQKRPKTGLNTLGADGKIDPTNTQLVEAQIADIHKDLSWSNGKDFDPTLVKYGLAEKPQLAVLTGGLPPKPKLGTLEIWEMYLEYKRPVLKETTFAIHFEGIYSNAIKQAIEAVGDDALTIRSWLLGNRCKETTKDILSHYQPLPGHSGKWERGLGTGDW